MNTEKDVKRAIQLITELYDPQKVDQASSLLEEFKEIMIRMEESSEEKDQIFGSYLRGVLDKIRVRVLHENLPIPAHLFI